MKLLAVIVVTLTLVLLVEKAKPTVTDDENIDNSILELEEELYQLSKQDTQEKKATTKASVGSDEKKGLRAPCGFSESCTRRRSSRRRKGFWGKKSQDNNKHQQTAHSSLEQDDFDQVVSYITKLAKEIENEKKNN